MPARTSAASAALLALADQRLPSGGHVHSGGVEQAITGGLISDTSTLEAFLQRRLRSAGLVAAGIAAAACAAAPRPGAVPELQALAAEVDARTPSPAQRLASRAQGRGLLRTASTAWPAPSKHCAWTDLGARPHHPIVLGAAAAAAGVDPGGAALVAAYLAVSAPSTAAQRLLALDPAAVAAVTVRLGPAVEAVARTAARTAAEDGNLPSDSDPLLDLLAERHAVREERLLRPDPFRFGTLPHEISENDPHAPVAGGPRKGPVRIGIGGPVGSGKTALVAALCRNLGESLQLGVVTNDIYTTEDADFLRRNAVLPDERIVAVQTGCCPHTAIRDDITANLDAIDDLIERLPPLDLVLVESGGDNLTASFSKGLVDAQIFVVDVAGGDKVPRKGGPGVTTADLLVINKTDLAEMVGADLSVMQRDAHAVRGDRPVIMQSLRETPAAEDVAHWVLHQLAPG